MPLDRHYLYLQYQDKSLCLLPIRTSYWSQDLTQSDANRAFLYARCQTLRCPDEVTKPTMNRQKRFSNVPRATLGCRKQTFSSGRLWKYPSSTSYAFITEGPVFLPLLVAETSF